MEYGGSDMTGKISYYDSQELPTRIDHNFTLLGLSMDYTLKKGGNVYAGWSQAYRPVVFKDIIPSSVYESVDKNLKDAYGYNLEAGYRGNTRHFRWDVGAFRIQYNNRMGIVYTGVDTEGNSLLERTNIGNSVTQGFEVFLEYNIAVGEDATLRAFTSTAFFNARYQDASIRVGGDNMSIDGNKVESVPEVITRNGVTFQMKGASLSVLYSYTAESYADAINTEAPSKNGAVGIVPAYGILDVNASLRISDNWMVRVNVNNIANEIYFTKRPQMYPGPGVWTSDGRSFNMTVGFKM
jgi:Fe(3+) dicitrate transport protein